MVVYRLQKVFGKSGSKVNGTWLVLVVPAENVREQRNIWKGSPVFPDRIFQAEIRVLFFQAIFDTSFKPSRSFSGKSNWFAQMVNEIPGRSKFTSPEFCVPFALTVDRPVCPCKWQTTDVNAFLPRGHRYYLRKKMYFFEFFYYNILHESHRYN